MGHREGEGLGDRGVRGHLQLPFAMAAGLVLVLPWTAGPWGGYGGKTGLRAGSYFPLLARLQGRAQPSEPQ